MTVERQARDAEAIELGPLFQGLGGESAVGESLRYEGTYDLIQEARLEDDPNLPQGVWQKSLKKADWSGVADLSWTALETRSKDLQLAAWLAEAWIHLMGFQGSELGFRLLRGLVEVFWDEIHPQIENGDLEARLAPFEWLNNKVSIVIKGVPITSTDDNSGQTCVWADWERCIHQNLPPAKKKQQVSGLTRETIQSMVSVTPTAFYQRLDETVSAAAEALDLLDGSLRERCGDRTPSFGEFRDVFQGVANFVERILEERGVGASRGSEEVSGGAAAASEADTEVEMTSSSQGPSGVDGIANRAEAYRMLRQATEYLLRTEPHSPVPYLVRRAISWGNLSLGDVLAELLRHNADLPTVYELLGIRSAEDLGGGGDE